MQALKEILIRYATQVLLVATIGLALWFGINLFLEKKHYAELYTELVGTRDKYEQLSKYTAKLETDYKTQKDLAQKAEETWKEVVRAKNEKIEVLSDATYLISKYVNTQNGPDYFYQTPKKTQNLIVDEVRLAGKDSPPIGFVVIKSDGTTYKGNYKFRIKVDSLQTRDEKTGKVQVYSKAYLIAEEDGLADKRRPDLKKWKGVEYPLNIEGGVALVDPTQKVETFSKHFYWWAPRPVGGLDLGVSSKAAFWRPMFGLSFMGYGVSEKDLDWRWIQVGIQSDSKLDNGGPTLVPFAVRPFPSVLSNSYLGPGIGADRNGTTYFLELSLGL